jgi:zinc finger protein
VKSDSCSFKVVELDFEIPPTGKKGTLNTIEGLLVNAVDGLQGNLPLYRAADESKAAQVEAFLNTLAPYSRGEVLPFTVVLDDPAGNSYIENPYPLATALPSSFSPPRKRSLRLCPPSSHCAHACVRFAPKPDPEMKTVKYTRNAEQDELLGLRADDDDSSSTSSAASSVPKAPAEGMTDEQARQKFEKAAEEQEVMKFPASCPNCEFAGEVRMVMCGASWPEVSRHP